MKSVWFAHNKMTTGGDTSETFPDITTKTPPQHPSKSESQTTQCWNSFSYTDWRAKERPVYSLNRQRTVSHRVCPEQEKKRSGGRKGRERADWRNQRTEHSSRRNQVKGTGRFAWASPGEHTDKAGAWNIEKANEGHKLKNQIPERTHTGEGEGETGMEDSPKETPGYSGRGWGSHAQPAARWW